jgi:hypothetical protein
VGSDSAGLLSLASSQCKLNPLIHHHKPRAGFPGTESSLTTQHRLGDVIDCLLAYWIIHKADQIKGGLPAGIKSRMYLNVAADFAIGLVPLLGDIADALYKANSRNTWLLEDYLVKKAAAEQNPQSALASDPEQGIPEPRPPKSSAPHKPQPTKKMQGKSSRR